MTYKELAEKISKFTNEQQNQDVIIQCTDTIEYCPVFDIVNSFTDVLDRGHYYLRF